jgi:hypothetical protein
MSPSDQDPPPPNPGVAPTKGSGERQAFDADARNERWLKVSIGLGRFEQTMWPLVLQLGRLDARLIQADEVWPERFFGPKLSYEDSSSLHEHITLSYLWVLGAYEFIRTLCDRVSLDDPDKTSPEVRDILLEVKNRFNRVRVPLAKMEAASKHAHEDSPIAYPGMKRGMGVAWILNSSTGVTRRELSDALLGALEKRRVTFLRYQAKQWREKPDSESPGTTDG